MRVRRISTGLRYMAAAAFFFSLMSLLVKEAGRRLPSQEIVLVRSAVGLALCWALLRRRRASPLGHRRGLLLLRGILGFGALSCFFYALTQLPLAEATVIQYTNPVFTAVLAALLLREHMGIREVAGLLLSLVGVIMVARPTALFGRGEALAPLAVAVALLGAIFSAGAYVAVRKLGETEDPLVIVLYFAGLAVLGSIPATVAKGIAPLPTEWLVLLGVGLATQAGQVYMTKGLREERAGRAMTVGYLQILFAGVWGALFFGELPDGWTIVGAAMVVAGTLAVA